MPTVRNQPSMSTNSRSLNGNATDEGVNVVRPSGQHRGDDEVDDQKRQEQLKSDQEASLQFAQQKCWQQDGDGHFVVAFRFGRVSFAGVLTLQVQQHPNAVGISGSFNLVTHEAANGGEHLRQRFSKAADELSADVEYGFHPDS